MTAVPATNHRRMINGYELNITARKLDSNEPPVYAELITRTVKLWLYLASEIQKETELLPEAIAYRSVEQSVDDDHLKIEGLNGFAPFDAFGENRVTVFDWNHKLELTLHSNSLPQSVLDLYWAMQQAKETLNTLYPAPQTAQDAPNSSVAPNQASNPQAPAPNFTEGAIVATRAPNPNNPQYADGQLVSFTVTKIAASSNKGSATFQMWTALGSQYPTVTVYKLDSKGQPKRDYENIVPVLNTLNLSFEKPEAIGAWRMICKAAHAEKDGKTKEYLNVLSLTPL